jgi:hypothetical protein
VTASLVSPVLVGRQAELAVLDGALERAIAGEPTAVLVGGEAGVGKSRLVQELSRRADEAGARVLVGGCVELGGEGIPFGPLVEVLRTLASELGIDELGDRLGPARGEIARLFPELEAGEQVRSSDDGASRVPELVLGLVSRLAAERPLVLVFEDVQWADRSTLDLLALLVRGLTGHALLICTVRYDELHRAHPFRRMAGRWDQQRSVERLELERLGAEEVGAQIQAILDQRPDGELVDLLFQRSEGIPLFVEELLGAVRDGRIKHDYLPPSLRDVLLARVDLLSEDAQHVLRVASASGRWAPEGLLGVAVGVGEDELYAALREIVEHQLLIVDPGGRGYAFRHALAGPRSTRICFRASARDCTVRTRNRSSRILGSPDLGSVSRRCSRITGSPLTTCPRRSRRRSEQEMPSRRRPHPQRRSAITSSRWSCGQGCPTQRSLPAGHTASCSTTPPTRPGMAARPTGLWLCSSRRSRRSDLRTTAGGWRCCWQRRHD